jgi:DNA polymerase-3 subunit delta
VSDPPDLEPVYLVTGGDRPKIEVALARLRRHFDPEAVDVVSAVDTPAADVIALCNTGNLFGTSRLVIVDAVDGAPNAEGRLTRGWKAADVAAVAAYLNAPAPGTTLALVAAELKKTSPLGKLCAKTGQVLEYGVTKSKLANWAGERFRAAGVHADPDACSALVHLVGDNVQAIASEVDKLVMWAGDEPVTLSDVERLVAAVADTPPFVVTDALAGRDAGQALLATEDILERSARPRRDEVARLSATLGGHAARLRTARRLSSAGIRSSEAMSELGTRSQFYADKLYHQAERFMDDELQRATETLAALDLSLKGDSKLPPDLELQRALVELTRDSGRSPAP